MYMKEFFSVKPLVSMISLLLAVTMLFSACASKNTAGNKSDLDSAAHTWTDFESESSDDSSGPGSDVSSNISSEVSSDISSGPSSDISSDVSSDPYRDISNAVRAKGVRVLMWREYTAQEQKLVNGFEKKTGIKVYTTVTTEADYLTKLISLISANVAPDVCCIMATDFPKIALAAMQTLNAYYFRLNDRIWYKNYMDYYKANNRYFSVAMRGAWSCEEGNYVTYYMPKVLKACGISEDPYSLYQQGKWNWDKQKEIATKIAKAGKDYIGISMQSDDLMMHSAGEDFVKLDGTKFTNALNNVGSNSLLTQA